MKLNQNYKQTPGGRSKLRFASLPNCQVGQRDLKHGLALLQNEHASGASAKCGAVQTEEKVLPLKVTALCLEASVPFLN